MNRVYVKKGKPNKGVKGYPWIMSGIYDYLKRELESNDNDVEPKDRELPDWKEFVNKYQIKVDDRGKPYLEPQDLHFSLSHSGDYWVLLISEDPCGIDVQRMEERDLVKIAKRFYSPKEYEEIVALSDSDQTGQIENAGDLQGRISLAAKELFYGIWSRREAFGKMTGEGFFDDMPDFVPDPVEEVGYRGERYIFVDLDLNPKRTFAEEYKCIALVKQRGETSDAADAVRSDGQAGGQIEIIGDREWEVRTDRDNQKDIYAVASRWLSYRDRTEKELRDYLKKNGYTKEEIDPLIMEFVDFGYLDEARYVEKFWNYGINKGWGQLRIKRELAKRGIETAEPPELENETSEFDRALEIADKMIGAKDYDERGYLLQKAKARISRRLYSYGYGTDTIFRVISHKNSDTN